MALTQEFKRSKKPSTKEIITEENIQSNNSSPERLNRRDRESLYKYNNEDEVKNQELQEQNIKNEDGNK